MSRISGNVRTKKISLKNQFYVFAVLPYYVNPLDWRTGGLADVGDVRNARCEADVRATKSIHFAQNISLSKI